MILILCFLAVFYYHVHVQPYEGLLLATSLSRTARCAASIALQDAMHLPLMCVPLHTLAKPLPECHKPSALLITVLNRMPVSSRLTNGWARC
ncbi:hypothetical protein LZ30DRAFT_301765 [Colletotrichum cereale]|nr:hypothetical protein LZ30DRAFT_301765 [Colletotrichum cereale]